ncbi:MAG: MFS transporter [Deltaproteobacteria bacterium]|nr:MFS transporter [Deltaproteobacteria bacterium]
MDLTTKEKQLLFAGSFLALAAAGAGFVFRSMVPGLWGSHFEVSATEVGVLFGASLWPVAVVMILFSLVVDRIGYRLSMYIAMVLQSLSVILTVTAHSYTALWVACLAAGAGHGAVEAIINPLCASVYPTQKSKMLNILHAAWPLGVVMGGSLYLTLYRNATTWQAAETVFWFLMLPVVAYGVLFALVKRFPVDERVANNISTLEMLRELGGMGAFMAITFLCYELSVQLGFFTDDGRLWSCVLVGLVGGAAMGFAVKSKGRWLFVFLCAIMIPLAATELGTDGWIKKLMEPAMGEHAGWALVISAAIMMVLRFFAGVPLRYLSPPALLLVSSLCSVIGLYFLSVSSGFVVFLAFVFFAVGQTFYWPTVLGLVSEQFPRGGAMTLNTVSAMGLLTVGIFGFPFFGAVQDNYNAKTIAAASPTVLAAIKSEKRTFGRSDDKKPIYAEKSLFGVRYESINADAVVLQPEFPSAQKPALLAKLQETGRSTLRVAALLPAVMAVAFVFILLHFRSRGGYRPVQLRSHDVNPT